MANRGYNPLVAIQMALSGQLSARGASSYSEASLNGIEARRAGRGHTVGGMT